MSDENSQEKARRGRKAVHANASARKAAWRSQFARRVDLLLSAEGSDYLNALEFCYPELSVHAILDAILVDRLQRKDFSLPAVDDPQTAAMPKTIMVLPSK